MQHQTTKLEHVNPEASIKLLEEELLKQVKKLNYTKSLLMIEKLLKSTNDTNQVYLFTKDKFKDLVVFGYDSEGKKLGSIPEINNNKKAMIMKVSKSNKFGIFKMGGMYILHVGKRERKHYKMDHPAGGVDSVETQLEEYDITKSQIETYLESYGITVQEIENQLKEDSTNIKETLNSFYSKFEEMGINMADLKTVLMEDLQAKLENFESNIQYDLNNNIYYDKLKTAILNQIDIYREENLGQTITIQDVTITHSGVDQITFSYEGESKTVKVYYLFFILFLVILRTIYAFKYVLDEQQTEAVSSSQENVQNTYTTQSSDVADVFEVPMQVKPVNVSDVTEEEYPQSVIIISLLQSLEPSKELKLYDDINSYEPLDQNPGNYYSDY